MSLPVFPVHHFGLKSDICETGAVEKPSPRAFKRHPFRLNRRSLQEAPGDSVAKGVWEAGEGETRFGQVSANVFTRLTIYDRVWELAECLVATRDQGRPGHKRKSSQCTPADVAFQFQTPPGSEADASDMFCADTFVTETRYIAPP